MKPQRALLGVIVLPAAPDDLNSPCDPGETAPCLAFGGASSGYQMLRIQSES